MGGICWRIIFRILLIVGIVRNQMFLKISQLDLIMKEKHCYFHLNTDLPQNYFYNNYRWKNIMFWFSIYNLWLYSTIENICLGSLFSLVSLDFMETFLKTPSAIFLFFTELLLILFFQINPIVKLGTKVQILNCFVSASIQFLNKLMSKS